MRSEPPEGWREVEIGDVAMIVGGGTPSTKVPANFDGDVPWLTPKDLRGVTTRRIMRGERNLSTQGLNGSSARLLPTDTVLVSSRAPIGYVALAANPIATNQGFRSLVVNSGQSPEYYYYLMRTMTPVMEAVASGTTFKEISGTTLGSLRVCIPRLPEQQRIASVLGALDDKIESNGQAISRANAVAEELFTHATDTGAALVHCRVDEIARINARTVKVKSAPKRVTYIDISSVRPREIVDRRECAFHEAPSRARRIVRSGDTIISTVRPERRAMAFLPQVPSDWIVSTGFAVVSPLSISPAVLYRAVTTDACIDHLSANASGSAYPAVNPAVLAAWKVRLPPDGGEALGQALDPLEALIDGLRTESRALASLRDTLLPKLISGEVRVPDSEDSEDALGTVAEDAGAV